MSLKLFFFFYLFEAFFFLIFLDFMQFGANALFDKSKKGQTTLNEICSKPRRTLKYTKKSKIQVWTIKNSFTTLIGLKNFKLPSQMQSKASSTRSVKTLPKCIYIQKQKAQVKH